MRAASLVVIAVAGCGGTTAPVTNDAIESVCGAQLPGSTAGLIGDAVVTLELSGTSFTTTFARGATTFTSQGDVSYPASNNLSLTLTSTSGIDEGCIGKEVIYSFAWSDDCKLVGLTRDSETCETRVNNLEGVTLAVQK